MDGTLFARIASHIAAFADTGGINTSVGHAEVVKMHYEIRIVEHDKPWETGLVLVNTDSFRKGVSLTEVKWSFYNPAVPGDKKAFLELDIHDLAGDSLRKFLSFRSMAYNIHFKGPDSYGKLWTKDAVIYRAIKDQCSLEFSPTQGFTYKIMGAPLGQLAGSKFMSSNRPITLKGLDYTNKKHGNRFKDYLDEYVYRWNENLPPDKRISGQLHEFEISESDTGEQLKDAKPVLVTNDENKAEFRPDGKSGKVLHEITFLPGEPVAHAITRLWNTRFRGVVTEGSNKIHQSGSIEVNYLEYKEGNKIHVRLHKAHETDVAPSIIPVCVGPDWHCWGERYRASLAGIDFGKAINLMGNELLTKSQQGESEVGQDQTVTAMQKDWKHKCGKGDQLKETTAKVQHSSGDQMSVNPKYDGWGLMQTALNRGKVWELTMDLDMAYSFGFTPEHHGGQLKDGVKGFGCGMIDPFCGVELTFYWYVDALCQSLKKVDVISTCYRISKVTHTIGLSGNSTQVSLTHMTVGSS